MNIYVFDTILPIYSHCVVVVILNKKKITWNCGNILFVKQDVNIYGSVTEKMKYITLNSHNH